MQAGLLLGTLGVSSVVLTAPVAAQDYTSGALSGKVTDDAGAPVAGATVTVTSQATGVVRTATTGSNGNFAINDLASGSYTVEASSAAGGSYRAEGVNVQPGTTTNLTVPLATGDVIVVTGNRIQQAFTGTTVGLSVDVEDFIKDKPLGRTVTDVVLLAPNTTAGDSSFGYLPSIGGSSVAENAYYLNGLNLTNFDNYLGGATVPFYFYKNVDVKNGGYPAEYGRATGGIVNAVSKAGSNEFFAAAHIDWAPQFLRSRGKDLYNTRYVDSNNPGLGTVTDPTTDRGHDKADSLLTTIEAGVPIIQDRLFVYGMAQFQRTTSLTNAPLSGYGYYRTNTDPFWGVKVDAYPIDSQHLELTVFDTRNTTTRFDRAYTLTDTGPVYGSAASVTDFNGGGLNFVGKYTGRFTDWFTLSAAYGRVRDRFDIVSVAGAGELPYFVNASGSPLYGTNSGAFFNDQTIVGTDAPYATERKFFRADADLRFSMLGEHHIRFGYDRENNTLDHVNVRNGGAYELANGFLSQQAYDAILGNGGAALIARPPVNGVPTIELNYFNTGGSFKAKNQAYYIQDEWNLTDRLTLNLGVRRDDFRVNKPSGKPIADLKGNYAPRAGFTFDVGDSGKFFGSYGWYYLPIASNTAFRQGAPSYYFRQRYEFTGIDGNGLPILGNLITNNGTYQTACPFALVPNGPTTNCNVTGDGADIDTSQAIAANLKATRESEIILGYEQKIDQWTFGLTYIHRNLDRTAEDSAIDAAVIDYCNANGIVATRLSDGATRTCGQIWTGYHQYVINNPGQDVVVNLLATGYDIDKRQITLTADQLGYGKATRKYDAVTFSFDRADNGVYSFGGSYTWSKSKGNSEGYVQSDFGQDDSGITQDFDQPGFVDYSYGYLPNDRRHQFKLYGSVHLNDDFTLGTFVQVQSPRPLSCFGWHPTDVFAGGYGAASHYCGGKPSPRGTAQKTDWYSTVNVSGRYNLHFGDHTLTLRADVFNLLNRRAVTSRNEFGDLDALYNADNTSGLPDGYLANPQYRAATGYQSPRYVRLGIDIAF